MKSIWHRLVAIGIAAAILLSPTSGHSCPNCFASATKGVLNTYYISAIFLSLLPFGVVGFISYWLTSKKQSASSSQHKMRSVKAALPYKRRLLLSGHGRTDSRVNGRRSSKMLG